MDQNELIANIVVLVVAILAGLGGYFRSRKPNPTTQESVSIYAGGVFNRHDTERFLSAVENCARSQDKMAAALVAIADQRSHDMDDKLEQLVNKVDKISARRRASD